MKKTLTLLTILAALLFLVSCSMFESSDSSDSGSGQVVNLPENWGIEDSYYFFDSKSGGTLYLLDKLGENKFELGIINKYKTNDGGSTEYYYTVCFFYSTFTKGTYYRTENSKKVQYGYLNTNTSYNSGKSSVQGWTGKLETKPNLPSNLNSLASSYSGFFEFANWKQTSGKFSEFKLEPYGEIPSGSKHSTLAGVTGPWKKCSNYDSNYYMWVNIGSWVESFDWNPIAM